MEGLKEVNTSILKVRNAVKYVKSSPSRLDNFKSCVERQKLVKGVFFALMFQRDGTLHN